MASAFKVRIDATAGEALLARLRGPGVLVGALREVGEFAVSESVQTFRESRDPYGQAWRPLAMASLLARARRRAGGRLRTKRGALRKRAAAVIATGKPLLDTGALRNSIAYRLVPGAVQVIASREYAAIHQFGGRAGRARRTLIPARPFLPDAQRGLPAHWRAEFEAILTRAVQAAASGAA